MRDPMTLDQALRAAPTYRGALAALACVDTEDALLAWAAHFIPAAGGLDRDERAHLWHSMSAAAANLGLEDRDTRAIVDEVMAAVRCGAEAPHG